MPMPAATATSPVTTDIPSRTATSTADTANTAMRRPTGTIAAGTTSRVIVPGTAAIATNTARAIGTATGRPIRPIGTDTTRPGSTVIRGATAATGRTPTAAASRCTSATKTRTAREKERPRNFLGPFLRSQRSDFDFGHVALALQPGAAVGRALAGQQHVHEFMRARVVVHGQLQQPPRVGVDGGFAQLQRVHLAQALEAGFGDLPLHALGLDAGEDAGPLAGVQCVESLLADVDAVQRRHGDEDSAGIDQRPEVAQEQRRQQGGDVQPV